MLFLKMVVSLARELEKSPAEKRDEILTKYFNESVSLESETEAVGAHGFMWDCIDSLYEESEEGTRRADRARLADGIVPCVELTDTERLKFAGVLLKTFKEVHKRNPFSFELQ